MKNLKIKGVSAVLFLSLAISCSQNEKIVQLDEQQKQFLTNVAIVQTNSFVPSKLDNSRFAVTAELFNFDKNHTLQPALKINDLEYSDNGQYNDLVAGDKIYTSIETFAPDQLTKQNNFKIAMSTEFQHSSQLIQVLKEKFPNNARTNSIGISCDIVTRPCPQTAWYNTCVWSSSCTCVYLENCRAEFSIF